MGRLVGCPRSDTTTARDIHDRRMVDLRLIDSVCMLVCEHPF